MINRIKLGVMVFLAVFALVYVSEARAVEVESLNGTWVAQWTWEDQGSWSDEWTITQKGKKITGHSDADYHLKGKIKGSKVNFKISGADCSIKCKGTLIADNAMEGTMQCTDYDVSGTWYAVKVSNVSASSDVSVNETEE